MKTTIRHCVLSSLCVFTLTFLLSLNVSGQSNNCATAVALTSSQACFNTAGTTVGSTYTGATGLPGTICNSTNADVWYTFTAASSNPTITLTQLTGTANTRRFQVFSGTCANMTELFCSGNSNTIATSALTPGQVYYIRVYANAVTTFTFNICITDTHDDCATPVTLTSSTACTNVPGNMYGATNTAITVSAPNCAPGTITRALWYRFTAQTTNPTITLTGVGASLSANVGMQLLSNTACGSTFTSYYCGTTSIAANYLTPGTVYMIRVYSTAAAPVTQVGWGFNICITDPVSPAPSNDNCAGAVNISVSNSCNSNPGTMAGATISTPGLSGSCTGPLAYDVWYKFSALSTSTVVTLGGIGANFLTPGIEVFSAGPTGCLALTSIACGNSPLTANSLTVGNTYYVRVYSRTAPPPNGNARFTICLTSSAIPVVRYGNSYVNISKKRAGGVVQPGDTLEIRMTVQHSSGTTMDDLRFLDNLPTKTAMLTGATDFLKVITNEGLTYKQYTRGADTDPGTYLPSPTTGGQFNIRMNLGFGAFAPPLAPANNTATETASATGRMSNGNFPRGNGSLLFATAYRVRVTGVVGDTIVLNSARFIYNDGTTEFTLFGTPYKILISNPLSLCTNSIGVNNATEFGGTFGTGTTLNRSTDLTAPIPGYGFLNDVNGYNGLGDGRYAIVNNIGPRSGTSRLANRVTGCGTLPYGDILNCNQRMHGGHWYIDGDHTGTNNAIGNTPPAAGVNSGYMLMVNADYVASQVFTQTITNLCPNTYYEFSAWFRNICPTCGIDSVGNQFTGIVTAPTNGYVGVYPNLSFSLNGMDYYSTGEIDTVGWLKKGFVFRTDTNQVSATFSIRNNSQGGGGNDWVMDDIAVATCLPTMSYSPTINPNVCSGNSITIRDTISSFFRNYTTYKWQKSTNGGGLWTDISGVTTLPDTNYYITSYTIPPGSTTQADSGTLYRVVVATTSNNLTNTNCNISDGVTITLSVNNCGIPLKTDLLSFNGKLVNDKGNLSWTTSKEDMPVTFMLERSNDGTTFVQIGTVNSYNDYTATVNAYSFIDPAPITGKAYYRLVLAEQSGARKFSRTIQLNRAGNENLGLVNVINPFNSSLEFDIVSKTDSKINVELLDLFGKVVQKATYTVRTGVNALSLPNTDILPSGTYILRIRNNEAFINRKVLKKSF